MTKLDCRGMRCPWPALRLARHLRTDVGEVELLADDPAAPAELRAVAAASGRSIAECGPNRFVVSGAN